ncbi:MAG TPA: glycosyltransferase [Solirubrobacterales bacterium]|jgi:glycosyltransferase involved in cell wall biosynthesis
MSGQQCELSVLIASHERRELLRRCLDSLAAQAGASGEFEVIVAVDGSTDGTLEMLEQYESPFPLRALRLRQGGKSTAVNAAIEAARGAVCLFLDDDVVASPQLVAEHLAAHREDPRTVGIGALTQQPPNARDWFARAYAIGWGERYAELERRQADWADCYGGNLSAPRAALLEIGGVATDLEAVEDLDLGFRLVEAGCVPRYLPRAHGVHDDQKLSDRILADTGRFGTFCAAYAERRPATRAKLLGWFLQTTPREILLRRLLLALRTPPRLLAAAGATIPGTGRRQVWFGFVSRYAFWRGVRLGMDRRRWRSTTGGVPVLMYHGFSDSGERDRWLMPKRSFARQMRLLAALRYRVIPFEELGHDLRHGTPPPRRAIVITIDDGYRDNLEIAQPILRRHGFPAIVFLVSAMLGGESEWSKRGASAWRPLLTAAEVMEMRARGMRFGGHTRTHSRLPETAEERIDAEVSGCREDIEGLLGEPIEAFAYPYGDHDERAAAAVERAGFTAACTVEPQLAGPGSDPMAIPRIEIRGSDSTLTFLRKLWIGGA